MQAISSSMEERPTLVLVRGLVEGGAADVRERCESALLPLWDAVKLLQSGLRDCQGSTLGLAGEVGSVAQAQVWLDLELLLCCYPHQFELFCLASFACLLACSSQLPSCRFRCWLLANGPLATCDPHQLVRSRTLHI